MTWKELKEGVIRLLSKIGEFFKNLWPKKQQVIRREQTDAIQSVQIKRETLTVLAYQMMDKQEAAAKVASEVAQKKEAQLKEVAQPIAQQYKQQATQELL